MVNTQGDTIRGEIDYKGWDRNPKSIFFRASGNESATSYGTGQLKTFKVLNEVYESAYVRVEESPTTTANLSSSSAFKYRQDSTFVRLLIEGPKNLYRYLDAVGKEHFFIRKGAELELLLFKKYQKDWQSYEVTPYKEQLEAYLSDCPIIKRDISALPYRRESFVRLFSTYYKCTNAQPESTLTSDRAAVEFGVLAGATNTKLRFTGATSDFPYLTQTNYAPSASPTGGLFLNVVLPRRNRHWSIANELLYTSFETQGFYTKLLGTNYYTNTRIELGYAHVKLNNMLRYSLPLGKAVLFAKAGVATGFVIKERNFREDITYFNSSSRTTTEQAFTAVRSVEPGLALGAGGRFGKFSGELRYETGRGVSNSEFFTSTTTRTYFLIGYFIK
ncbi:PorT family protein [Solirubrum puertoriconensis]|uniref:PorT family protein n=1 Tax=Solirubrum puertoriconensis TaxID=1751427 RepID=UPI00122E8E9F|nr:PorT family protein [Solirubrum puertoriconensis]